MLGSEAFDIDADGIAVDYLPCTADHNTVSPMGPAENQRGYRIAGAREAQLVERIEGEVRLLANRDFADVGAAETTRRSAGRPTQHVEMADGRIIGQAIDHERMADTLHQI